MTDYLFSGYGMTAQIVVLIEVSRSRIGTIHDIFLCVPLSRPYTISTSIRTIITTTNTNKSTSRSTNTNSITTTSTRNRISTSNSSSGVPTKRRKEVL